MVLFTSSHFPDEHITCALLRIQELMRFGSPAGAGSSVGNLSCLSLNGGIELHLFDVSGNGAPRMCLTPDVHPQNQNWTLTAMRCI